MNGPTPLRLSSPPAPQTRPADTHDRRPSVEEIVLEMRRNGIQAHIEAGTRFVIYEGVRLDEHTTAIAIVEAHRQFRLLREYAATRFGVMVAP